MNTQGTEQVGSTLGAKTQSSALRPGSQAAKGNYWIPGNTKDFSDQPAFKQGDISFNADESSSLSSSSRDSSSEDVVMDGEVVTIGEYQAKKSSSSPGNEASTDSGKNDYALKGETNSQSLSDNRFLKMKATDPSGKETDLDLRHKMKSQQTDTHSYNQISKADEKTTRDIRKSHSLDFRSSNLVAELNAHRQDVKSPNIQNPHNLIASDSQRLNSYLDKAIQLSSLKAENSKSKSTENDKRNIKMESSSRLDFASSSNSDITLPIERKESSGFDLNKKNESKQDRPEVVHSDVQNTRLGGDFAGEVQKNVDKQTTSSLAHETAQKILRQMERFRSSGLETFRFTLNLPDGDVTIRLSMQGKKLNTHFISDSKEFSEQLQSGWSQISGLANKNGIDLAFPTIEQKSNP